MFEDATKNRVARWIAGDISISREPGSSLKRWREKFGINQNTLAEELDISPSVISDYESGRRKSPGVGVIKKIVRAFLDTDEARGGQVTRAFAHRFGARLPPEIILDMREFERPLKGEEFVDMVDGEVLANESFLDQNLFGYTVIDSPKAILELSSEDLAGLYGLSTERALIFTKVSTGRSPMIAIKVQGVTPGLVVLHGAIEEADRLGVRIAENLKVPLVISHTSKTEDLLSRLQSYLFSVDEDGMSEELDGGSIPQELKVKLEDGGYPVSDDFSVSVEEKGSEWKIDDKNRYVVKREDDKLNLFLRRSAP